MRSTIIELQPLVTIEASDPSVIDPIIQHSSRWVDTHGYSRATLQVHVLEHGSGDLNFQTSDGLNFGWTTSESEFAEITTAAGSAHYTYALARNVDLSDRSRLLRRYIRWVLDDFVTPPSICFRAQIQLMR